MKKTLLAAALLAGFATAGVAQAETSVTLYGILDTGYGYSQVKYNENGVDYKSTNSGMNGGVFNGNRFGLRGSEDLGDGLRAIFTLEQGFNLGTGYDYGRQWHRQAWVGLASDTWGTFTMGRQYNMGAKFVYDNFNFGVASGDFDNGFGSLGYSNRMDNSFRYITPDFGGFSAGFAYGNGETNITRGGGALEIDSDTGLPTPVGNTERTNWTSAGLQYKSGPIAIGASYDRQNTNGEEDAMTGWALGASYDFEVVKLALVYGQDRHGKMGSGAAPVDTPFSAQSSANDYYRSDFKSNNYHVGLRAPVGGGNLNISWTRSDSNLDDSSDFKAAGFDEKAQDNYAISYQYPLSKRTSVYAYGGYTTGYAYIDGMKATDAGIGLNHKF